MYYSRYPDLTSAYMDINSKVWGDLGTIQMGSDLVPPPMVLEIDNSQWDLDLIPLNKLGYSEHKIDLLIKNYHDNSGWDNFYPRPTKKRLGVVIKKRDVTYYFKKKPKGENCLILVSYHRVSKQYTVVWRTTELGARWGG